MPFDDPEAAVGLAKVGADILEHGASGKLGDEALAVLSGGSKVAADSAGLADGAKALAGIGDHLGGISVTPETRALMADPAIAGLPADERNTAVLKAMYGDAARPYNWVSPSNNLGLAIRGAAPDAAAGNDLWRVGTPINEATHAAATMPDVLRAPAWQRGPALERAVADATADPAGANMAAATHSDVLLKAPAWQRPSA